ITETHTPQAQTFLTGGAYQWRVIAFDGLNFVAGPIWSFLIQGGSLPITITSFEARQAGRAVEVHWKLSSDEPMSSYTIYRREGDAHPITVADGTPTTEGSYLDNGVEAGKTYRYELLVRTNGGDEFRSQPATVTMAGAELTLHQNHPNPFNPQTTIAYDLPSASRVRLLVVDVSGKLVRTLVNETQSSGSRSVIWNGRDDNGNAVSSGVYFYVLDAGKERLTRKLVLLK
ncbi:MAG TPA: FlgD immunoglobulin-like domain containing protein, partial [Candidatus Krumholzibacteria bacterium]|nr:FlgD immunoglobulin-like domain containing protein [Candidatus Krumholzibacteria bacterium]